MNKYQEALDRLCNFMLCGGECSVGEGKCKYLEPLQELIDLYKILKNENKVLNINMDGLFKTNNFLNARIDELTHQPTVSECIKEWVERGFEIISGENYIVFRHHKTYKSIAIYLVNLSYKTYEWYDEKRPIEDRLNIDETQFITLELHNLIHKTLKALEVKDD